MGVLWDKIRSDLWQHKGRTIQVVLIIAVGAFSIGMIIGARNFLIGSMRDSWRASKPAMIYLWTSPAVDDDALAALAHGADVAAVEGFMQGSVEWRLSPDDSWSPAGLIARDDFAAQTFATLELFSGAWPQRKSMAVGQGADSVYGIRQGAALELRVDGHVFDATVGGVVSDPNAQPPGFGGNPQFYVTRERFGELTGDSNFNRIFAAAGRYDEADVTALADEMQDKLERQGVDVGGASPTGGRTADPSKHFFQDAMDGIFFIMGIMAVFALVLGLFLVYNTVTALVKRQVNQIGILKAIGATSGLVFRLYLTLALSYGVLALLVALPLGMLGARLLGDFLLNAFNANGEFVMPASAIVAEVVIALLSPVIACVVPVYSGARITVREAISTYGLPPRVSRLDRLLARLRRLPQLVVLTISNTFRNKQRVLLTQITLVLSGLIFMTVMSVRDSTIYTFDDLLFSILRFNVNFQLERPERIERAEMITMAQPGVKAVELWKLDAATIRPAGQPESNDDEAAVVFGVPMPTQLYSPQMRAGRWLTPEDRYAMVLNQELAADAGVTVGDSVTIDFGLQGDSDWQVVGLLFDPIITLSAHAPRDILLHEMHQVDQADTIWIQSVVDSPAAEAALATALRERYRANKLKINPVSVFGKATASEIVDAIMGQFAVILTLLATMAVLIGVVGSIALSGVLSLNVLERRREIGVLRAVGASSGVIAGLFIGEGLILGWLSWLIALPLSMPAGRLMVRGLSAALSGEIVYSYSPAGALIWLAAITFLAVAASWLPARAASGISVRESLAYE